jgi:hypothetical protein
MKGRPRETQIPVGPLVAAIGAVLLIVSLGMDWYGRLSGFNSFEVLDLLLVVLALVTLAGFASAFGLLPTPLRPGTPLVAAVIALLVVFSQLVNRPPLALHRDVETGLWLGLAGAALMLAGAILSTARIAIAVEPRRPAAPGSPAAPTRPAAPEPEPPAAPEAPEPPAAPEAPADQAPTVADQPRP